MDTGAAYESMIEELTQSDLEKGDRIAELEQIVEEMQEMEQLHRRNRRSFKVISRIYVGAGDQDIQALRKWFSRSRSEKET